MKREKQSDGNCFRPEIQSFLEKVKRQQEAKLKQQESDNRPFILKYVSCSSFSTANIDSFSL